MDTKRIASLAGPEKKKVLEDDKDELENLTKKEDDNFSLGEDLFTLVEEYSEYSTIAGLILLTNKKCPYDQGYKNTRVLETTDIWFIYYILI